MSAVEAFLADILAHPDDDTPRLVCADWLDDNGQPARAEFIRVQCRLALGDHALVSSGGGLDADDLREREEELLDEHGADWAAPLRPFISEWAFSRGFVEYAGVSEAWLPGRLDLRPLTAAAPVRALSLSEFGVLTAPALLQAGDLLGRLRYLHLADLGGSHGPDLHALLASPRLTALETLFLDVGEVEPSFPRGALAALGQSPALARLRTLGLVVGEGPDDLPPNIVRALARSPHLRLERLYLAHTTIDARLARELAQSPAFAGLRVLSLSNCDVPGELFPAGAFPALTELELELTPIPVDSPVLNRPGIRFVTVPHRDGPFPTLDGHAWPD